MDTQLRRLYAENRAPVAFLDESYELREGKTFYIVASAVVYPDDLASSRAALLEFYGGDTMHAAPMYRRNELASIRGALALAARQHDGMDVVVQTAVESDDGHGHGARRRCLSFLAPLLHDEEGTMLFVLDSLETPAANRHDRFTFGDLRRAGTLGPLPLILDTLSDGFRPRYRAYRASPPRTHSERRSRSLSAASSCCTGSPTGTPPGTRSPHQGTLPTPREALVSKPR